MTQNVFNIWKLRAAISLPQKIIPILFGYKQTDLPKWKLCIFWGGRIKNLFDHDINSLVKELSGPWMSSVYMSCPANPDDILDITLPFLVIVMKNMNRGFAFEAHIIDNKGVVREIYATTNRSTVQWSLHRCCVPLRLDAGWNKITLNLAHYTRLLFSGAYVKTLHVKVFANCRLRHIYFADRRYTNQELPDGYKVHLPFCTANASIFSKLNSDYE